MSALIIKITQNGSSQEYLFNKLGPIVIGSDKRCDLWLEDSHIDPKLLEVKISGGNIFVKELGARGEIYLDSVILPYREETRFHEGSCITLKDTNYQIHIAKGQSEAQEPPPFFEHEFKETIERMNSKIREKELEIKSLDSGQEKKKSQLMDIEDKYHQRANEKSKLEVELVALKTQKEVLGHELRKNLEKNCDAEEKIIQLRDHIQHLEDDERNLKDTIVAQGLVLTNLRDEREKKNKEVEEQRILLANLQLDTSQMEDHLKELKLEFEGQEKEIQNEHIKVEKILVNTDLALKEKVRVQNHIGQLIKEKSVLDHELHSLHEEISDLEKIRKENQSKLIDLKLQMQVEEEKSKKIHEEIRKNSEEETNLKTMNGELRSELAKVEEKLSLKKNQLNQLDFQNQDANRKLSTVNFELDRATNRLKELLSEEKTQERKMLAIRDDMQNLLRKVDNDKKVMARIHEEEKLNLANELASLKSEIEDEKKVKLEVEKGQSVLFIQIEELDIKQKSLKKEKDELELQVSELVSMKNQLEFFIKGLKDETLKLDHDKNSAHRELTQLQIKLMNCETEIREKKEEAKLEIESYKRDERARIVAEKEVSLSEVEAFRQKSLIEVEAEYRRKQEDIHQIRTLAHEKADEIIHEARRIESELTKEATQRLKIATMDAQERESSSHQRVKEAQEYFKAKESEAELIVNKARLESRDLMKKTEMELLEDLSKRKQKIKNFLKMKQETGIAHIKTLTEQNIAKIEREREKEHQKLESIKRKELKKIARIRDEELSRQSDIKDSVMKELNLEREKTLRQIAELRKNQEAELADKKRTMLEHINSTKFSQQKGWEDELKREREAFNRMKKERISNATQAVMNVFIAETGPQGDKEQLLKDKIRNTLEMAIEGQKAEALKEVDQILDFNPVKRKKIISVLQKYTVRVGIPAAIAIVMVSDIGFVRTSMIEKAKEVLKQQHSASEMYVNQQKIEWKEKHTFNPDTTPDYKRTFTENVVYTTDFEKVMDNEEFQNDWILKVHDFMVKDLELSEDVAINYISSESTLIKELSLARKDLHPQFLEQGMKKLHSLEQTHLNWLKEKIPEVSKQEKFADFRRDYYNAFYSEKFKKDGRGLATEAKKE